MELSFWQILLVFVAISLIVTFLIKKYAKADTYFVISLIKTQKPLPFFDRMAKYGRFLDTFTAIGLVFGFGALAVDFLYGRKLPRAKRMGLFLASFAALTGLMYGVDIFLNRGLSTSVLIGSAFPLLAASFGLSGLAGFTLFSLLLQAWDIVAKYLIGVKSCPGVAPLIPGVEIPGVPITPPLHAWISLLIILLAHEGMHGIVGRRHGFKVKSTGVLLFGPLPIGAFVEPDENELKTVDEKKLLGFLAAGPMANLALMAIAGVVLAGSLAAVGPLTDSLYPGLQKNIVSGVKVNSVLENTEFCGSTYASSAFGAMKSGDEIKYINGAAIANLQDLYNALQKDKFSWKTFVLDRNGTAVTMTLAPNAMGQFGFRPENIRNDDYKIPESFPNYIFAVAFFTDFFYWLFLLNFLVASINFLPMNPFDGGRMGKIIYSEYFGFLKKPKEETQRIISRALLTIILLLLFVNALPLLI